LTAEHGNNFRLGVDACAIKSLVKYETAERLEDEIRDLLRNWNVDATIEYSITGNTTKTADRDDKLVPDNNNNSLCFGAMCLCFTFKVLISTEKGQK
jgi:hypothetical protein